MQPLLHLLGHVNAAFAAYDTAPAAYSGAPDCIHAAYSAALAIYNAAHAPYDVPLTAYNAAPGYSVVLEMRSPLFLARGVTQPYLFCLTRG